MTVTEIFETVELWIGTKNPSEFWMEHDKWLKSVKFNHQVFWISVSVVEKLTKVDQMWYGVKPSLAENQPSHNFMEVDAVVQGKLVSQAHVSEERHEVSKHKY